MRYLLTILLTLSSLMLYSCASMTANTPCVPQTVTVKEYIRCEVPDVPKSELETINPNDTYEEKLRKLISNYGKLKEENILLRKAIDVCR